MGSCKRPESSPLNFPVKVTLPQLSPLCNLLFLSKCIGKEILYNVSSLLFLLQCLHYELILFRSLIPQRDPSSGFLQEELLVLLAPSF